jgi:hypothetical protein
MRVCVCVCVCVCGVILTCARSALAGLAVDCHYTLVRDAEPALDVQADLCECV